MPNFVVRDVPHDIFERFTARAKRENWPLRALCLQLMNDFGRGEIRPSGAPPEQMPIYAWIRPYFRTLARHSHEFLQIGADAQWRRLVHHVRQENPQLVNSLEIISAERRLQVLNWLRDTSEDLRPGPNKLTLRAIAHIGHGPSLTEGRRVVQYEVVGLPPSEQAFIFDQPHKGWQILRVSNGESTGWQEEYYESAQEALAYIETLRYLEDETLE